MTTYTREQQDENLRTWITALRSDDWTQGYSVLCRVSADGSKTTYCCLGVGSELAYRAGATGKSDDDADNGVAHAGWPEPHERWPAYGGTDADQSTWTDTILPRSVANWLGLQEVSPLVSLHDELTPLVLINDDRKLSSPEIADLIESHFLINGEGRL